jgi:hypothetical protein
MMDEPRDLTQRPWPPDIGEASRSHAARILLGLFDPGGIVELALASHD